MVAWTMASMALERGAGGPALRCSCAAGLQPFCVLDPPARAAPYPARRKLLAPPRPRPAWGTTSSSTVR
eukprot:SAG31_NODE_24812_length_473_cov_4.037433_1_plen_68_part_01